VYHHETKNLLVSYSPKKLNFFQAQKPRQDIPGGALLQGTKLGSRQARSGIKRLTVASRRHQLGTATLFASH
jgi:hypothetical protein